MAAMQPEDVPISSLPKRPVGRPRKDGQPAGSVAKEPKKPREPKRKPKESKKSNKLKAPKPPKDIKGSKAHKDPKDSKLQALVKVSSGKAIVPSKRKRTISPEVSSPACSAHDHDDEHDSLVEGKFSDCGHEPESYCDCKSKNQDDDEIDEGGEPDLGIAVSPSMNPVSPVDKENAATEADQARVAEAPDNVRSSNGNSVQYPSWSGGKPPGFNCDSLIPTMKRLEEAGAWNEEKPDWLREIETQVGSVIQGQDGGLVSG